VLAAVVVALAVPAEARPGWPRPAAGESHSGDPEVIFTFDDGPHERYSAMILDTLAKHGINAIFYWVGHRVDDHRRDSKKRRRRRALVERAITDGHLIGNHTINHVHLCHQKIDAAAEIDQNHSLYERLAAFPIVLFRAPYGDRCRRLEVQLGERGFTHMHWDIDPREYHGLTAEDTAEYVIGKLRGLRGRAVVLMHDTKGASARALPRILEWIDLENQRRQQIGKRPIRILSGSDWLIQSQHGPLWAWGEETASAARGLLGRAVGSLVPGAPESPLVADDEVPGRPATSAALEAGQRPASAGLAGGPVAPGSAGGPVAPASASGPVAPGSAGGPVAPASASGPVVPGSAGGPVVPGSAGGPVVPGSAGGPVAPGSASGPVAPGSASGPVAPASASVAGGPAAPARLAFGPPAPPGVATGPAAPANVAARPAAPASAGVAVGPAAPAGVAGGSAGPAAPAGVAGGSAARAGVAGGSGAPASIGSAVGQRPAAPASAPGGRAVVGASAAASGAGPRPAASASATAGQGGQRPATSASPAGGQGGQRPATGESAGVDPRPRPGVPAVAGAPARTHTSTLASP
jgi:peptidoglycan/xylan/chitin deacetylase (PgdA/CDA1 family)